MKVYELILLIYSLVVITWVVCGVRKEERWYHWFFEYSFTTYMVRAMNVVFVLILLIFALIYNVNWSWLFIDLC